VAGQLLLRLPATPGEAVAWLADDDGVTVARGDDALTEAATYADGRRVVALLAGSAVLLTRVGVPSRKPHHVRQAVPFLLEERLAADVATLHFAIGPRDAAGDVAVAVTDRERLQAWLEALAAAGLDPAAVVPEPLALPEVESAWTLAADDTGLQLRNGPLDGYTLDREALPMLVERALAEADVPPASVLLHGIDADAMDGLVPAGVSLQSIDGELLDLLAQHAPRNGCPLDLLQGPFARDTGQAPRWREWRRPLALAACLLLLLVGLRAWEVRRLDRETARLAEAQATVLREAFPDISRVVDPVAQMRQRIARVRGNGDVHFLDLLDASGSVLAEASGWQLAGLDYRDGTLRLQLRMPGFDHFEKLRGRFAGRDGIRAEIGSLGSVDGEVRGSVTLTGSGT
jgi:general secretion pathway protein L